ncbi:SET domain-containing protein [Trichodelitschia bisporula]|uniref:SET domain-containing protein n=1 Tax=Trichodelitschia bisporula TaxID=703511 RepID=A0A6G1HNN2_9PEZI|nr:SET domain-containing protein [Trichodelitschia bisporula]
MSQSTFSSTIHPWAVLNGVRFGSAHIGPTPGHSSRGSALLATADLPEAGGLLLVVPRDLVLSRETVLETAKADRGLAELLEATREWATTPRLTILLFLLHLTTTRTSHSSRFTTYLSSLPTPPLPTLWPEHQVNFLSGTTLASAVTAKLSTLHREWTTLASLLADHTPSLLTWTMLDAQYRSRALELPPIGACMAPILDMANHASSPNAYYDVSNGDIQLHLHGGAAVAAGEEITISYGSHKGACEMLFSYGFLPSDMCSAGTLFLPIALADDDPLAPAKRAWCTAAPGVRISDAEAKEDEPDAADGEAPRGVTWDSDALWLAVVNEEDGLSIRAARRLDGRHDLVVLWRDSEVPHAGALRPLLEKEELWPVLLLRATVVVRQVVEAQVEGLEGSAGEFERAVSEVSDGEDEFGPTGLARRLRGLELDLLKRAEVSLDGQIAELMRHPTVTAYLESMNADSGAQGEEATEDDDLAH